MQITEKQTIHVNGVEFEFHAVETNHGWMPVVKEWSADEVHYYFWRALDIYRYDSASYALRAAEEFIIRGGV